MTPKQGPRPLRRYDDMPAAPAPVRRQPQTTAAKPDAEAGRAPCEFDRLTLRTYLTSHFIPNRRREGAQAFAPYRVAINSLARFYKRDPRIGELSDHDLRAWRDWLSHCTSPKTLGDYIHKVRTVLRHAAPDRYPRYFPRVRCPVAEPELGSLLEFFETVYVPVRLGECNAHTLTNCRIALGRFERYLGRPAMLMDLSDDAIAGWAYDMRHSDVPGRKVKAVATINSNVKKVLAIWRLAARRRLVDEWPEVRRFKEPKRIPQTWTLEQFSRLLEACRCERGKICDVPAGPWWHALHLFIYCTGARIGATLALRWKEVDLAAGVVTLLAENQKQFADQQFRLPTFAVDSLKAIEAPKRELVWPRPIADERTIYYAYKKLLESAGLPHDRKLKFHAIRRLSGSLIKAAGGDAVGHLGHSSAKMTELYMCPAIVGIASQCHLLPNPVGGAS